MTEQDDKESTRNKYRSIEHYNKAMDKTCVLLIILFWFFIGLLIYFSIKLFILVKGN